MPLTIPQTSFGGGELAPSLFARWDLAKYGSGAKRLLNFFVHAHGGASNRAGLEWINSTKDHAKKSRLITFRFSSTQQYALEFGHLYIRVFKDGGRVVYPVGHPSAGLPVEVVTPYTEAELPLLKVTGSNDVMTICHRNHEPRELKRTDHHLWALDVIVFAPSIATPTGVAAAATGGTSGKTYKYKVTALAEETLEESVGSTVATVTNSENLSNTVYNTVSWTAVVGAKKYAIYKEKNGVFGFIGFAEGATSFQDLNIAPTLDDTPPEAANPFDGAGKYPGVTAFFEQRRAFACTTEKPSSQWFSKSSNFKNMTSSSPSKDDDSIEFNIASNEQAEIRWFISLNGDLILLTNSGEWKCGSASSGDVLSPTSIRVRPQGYRGCADVPPIVIGHTVLFVQEKGAIIRDLGYDLNADAYIGNDLSILSNHLFYGRKVVDWAYSQAPHSIIWVVLDNGKLLSFTYLREHEVWAWSQHQTKGFVESVCSVSEPPEDAAYFIVRRTIEGQTRRFVERLHSRTFTNVQDAFFVDCGLSYDAPMPITGITTGASTVVTCPAHGLDNGDEVDLDDVVGCDTLNPLDDTETVSEVNGKRFVVANKTTSTFELLADDGGALDSDHWFGYYEGGTARLVVSSISGLDHLEGEKVAVLANGSVYGDKGEVVVTDGTIPLEYPSSRVHVGLPYIAELRTLPLGGADLQDKKKRVNKVTMRVEATRGLKVGPAPNRLTELKPRTTERYGQPAGITTGDIEVTIDPAWTQYGDVIIRQDYPLPVTILALMADVGVGG